MTQQPFYPQQPQFPGYPPQQQFPQQGYAPQMPQQQFPVPVPGPPPVNGTLDDFYNQPSTGGGPSLSWKDKPVGTSYAGIVARDVTSGDVQQQTNFNTKQPEFYRDGRPKFVLKVPLHVQPSPEFPEGEASFYVRGQARDELARAMAEAGCSGAPVAGAGIVITLAQRKPSGQGMNPSNVFQIRYQPPAGGAVSAPAPAVQAPTPVATSPVTGVASQPAPVQQMPQQQYAPQAVPVAQPQQVAPAPVQQPVPVQQMPADFNAEQQELLARLTQGQQG